MREPNLLIVTTTSLQAIWHWPLELRALFDPDANRELSERAAAIRERDRAERERRANDESPF